MSTSLPKRFCQGPSGLSRRLYLSQSFANRSADTPVRLSDRPLDRGGQECPRSSPSGDSYTHWCFPRLFAKDWIGLNSRWCQIGGLDEPWDQALRARLEDRRMFP